MAGAFSLPPRGRVAEPKAKPGGRGSARGEPVLALPSPPHPVAARPRRPVVYDRPSTPKGEGEVWGMALRRLLARRLGRARGGRASPGAVVELPFRRSRPAPRSRFPRALRLAALASGLTGSPPRTLLTAAREGHGLASSPLHWPAASRQGPSIDPRKDPRGIHPPGFIARPQPTDIGALDPTPSPPTGWAGV